MDNYDGLPEDEGKIEANGGLDNSLFEAGQARLNEQQNQLRAKCIENGEDANKFLNSNFGQYILGQADLEAEAAKEELVSVDPNNKAEITKLQNIIWRCRAIESWVKSAVDMGDSEYKEYLESRE